MAVTAEQLIKIKDDNNSVTQAFPVASGQTIYKGTFAGVNASGYLVNLTTTTAPQVKMIVVVKDGTANTTGPAATTANGSISGTYLEASADAGDKTVRQCYTYGTFEVTGSSLAQTAVGSTMYAIDNYTIDETNTTGGAAGTLVAYYSATSGLLELNRFYNGDSVIVKGAVTAATTTTGGDAISWTPGVVCYLEEFHLDITTEATGAATMDVGVAADGTTSSDTLIDGVDVGTAAIYANPYVNGGTNGAAPRKLTATQYVTGTPSASLAGLVGTWVAVYTKA